MSTPARFGSRVALRGVAVASYVAALAAAGLRFAGEPGGSHLILVFLATTASFLAVGLVLAERRPSNPIGALLFALGLAFAAYVGLDSWVAIEGAGHPWAALVVSLMDGPLFLVVMMLFLIFPDGRPPSDRWRTLPLVAVVLAGVVLSGAALRPGPFPYYTWLDNPLRPPPNPVVTVWEIAYGLLVGCVVLAALSLASRWRRAGTAERAQLKWAASAAVLVALAMVGYGGATGPSRYNELGDLSIGVTLGLFPIAIGVAVLRYRLFEIDRIVSRTVSWAIVTGLLVAVFAGGVIGLQAALSDITQGETLAVAASTLLAAALFQPVRGRVQRVVDHRFNRARYDAEGMTQAFAEQLRARVDFADISNDVGAAVRGAVRPQHLEIWLRRGDPSASGRSARPR